jgi:hypothetical protein
MFTIVGTSVLDNSVMVITTDDPFGFLDSCGWEFGTIVSIGETK